MYNLAIIAFSQPKVARWYSGKGTKMIFVIGLQEQHRIKDMRQRKRRKKEEKKQLLERSSVNEN